MAFTLNLNNYSEEIMGVEQTSNQCNNILLAYLTLPKFSCLGKKEATDQNQTFLFH